MAMKTQQLVTEAKSKALCSSSSCCFSQGQLPGCAGVLGVEYCSSDLCTTPSPYVQTLLQQ